MSAATLARPLRVPLTWLALAALVLLSLVALESFGVNQAPRLIPIDNISQNTTTGSGSANTTHCTDGNGQDTGQNKHCRGISDN
jgi:hypothetical protein